MVRPLRIGEVSRYKNPATQKRALHAQRGLTYLALLFWVALSGIALAATGSLWSVERQREKEEELLFVGGQIRAAIGSYYQRSPGLVKRYPSKLEDLLLDNRYLNIQRHLRQKFADPMTHEANWGLIMAPEGGIMGVHSLHDGQTMKRSGFALADAALEGKERYTQWQFVYRPTRSRE